MVNPNVIHFPSFSGEEFTAEEMRQFVSALEIRFQGLEGAENTVSDFDPNVSDLDARFAPLNHLHQESEISDLQNYLINLNNESIFELQDVVDAPSVISDGLILQWSSVNQRFDLVPGADAVINLADLADVNIITRAGDDVLFFNGATQQWNAGNVNSLIESFTFESLVDTDIVGGQQYDMLFKQDSAIWADTSGELTWNPDTNSLTLANAHSINWEDATSISKEMLILDSEAIAGNEVHHFQVAFDTMVTSTSASYVNITGARIAAADLEVGFDYIILARATTETEGTAGSPGQGVRMTQGGVEITGSEKLYEELTATIIDVSGSPYYWVGRITAHATNNIDMQHKQTGGGTIATGGLVMQAIKIDDLGENENIFWTETASDPGVEITAAQIPVGTELTIGDSASDWLVIACVQGGNYASSSGHVTTVEINDGTTTRLGFAFANGDITDQIVQTFAHIYTSIAPTTLSLEARLGAFTGDILYSSMCAIRLNAFSQFKINHALGPVTPPDASAIDYEVLISALTSTNWAFWGSSIQRSGSTTAILQGQMPVDIDGAGEVELGNTAALFYRGQAATTENVPTLMISADQAIQVGSSIDAQARITPQGTPSNARFDSSFCVAHTWTRSQADSGVFSAGNEEFRTDLLGTTIRIPSIGFDAGTTLDHLIKREHTYEPTTAEAYVDFAGTSILADDLTNTEDYMLWARANHASSATLTGGMTVRLMQGSSVLATQVCECIGSGASNTGTPFQFAGRITANNQAIKLQHHRGVGGVGTHEMGNVDLVAYNINQFGPTNFFDDEDTFSTTALVTASWTNSTAGITIGDGVSDWLVYVSAKFENQNSATSDFRLGVDDGASVFQLLEQEVERTSDEYHWGGSTIYQGLAAGTTLVVSGRMGAAPASQTGQMTRAYICAIRLNAFAQHEIKFDAGPQTGFGGGEVDLAITPMNFSTRVPRSDWTFMGMHTEEHVAGGTSGTQRLTADRDATGEIDVAGNPVATPMYFSAHNNGTDEHAMNNFGEDLVLSNGVAIVTDYKHTPDGAPATNSLRDIYMLAHTWTLGAGVDQDWREEWHDGDIFHSEFVRTDKWDIKWDGVTDRAVVEISGRESDAWLTLHSNRDDATIFTTTPNIMLKEGGGALQLNSSIGINDTLDFDAEGVAMTNAGPRNLVIHHQTSGGSIYLGADGRATLRVLQKELRELAWTDGDVWFLTKQFSGTAGEEYFWDFSPSMEHWKIRNLTDGVWLNDGAYFRFYDTTDIQFMQIQHLGNDIQFTGEQTTDFNFFGAAANYRFSSSITTGRELQFWGIDGVDFVDAAGTPRNVLNLTPDTGSADDAYYNQSRIIADFDGADAATTFTEGSADARVATFVDNAQLDTAFFKYGTASLLVDGAGDFVTFPDTANLAIGQEDFTIEADIRFNTLPVSDMAIMSHGDSLTDFSWVFRMRSDDELEFRWNDSGLGDDVFAKEMVTTDVPVLATATWYHVAVVRGKGGLKFFFNGTLLTPSTDPDRISGSDLWDTAGTIKVGANGVFGQANYFDGWIDNARFTVGVARYSASFTPPIAAHSETQATPDVLYLGDSTFKTQMRNPFRTIASATASSGFHLPEGVAPTSPEDGDLWVTTTDAFVRVNGVSESIVASGAPSEINDLTAIVTWANVPDANITAGSVTQHEAALTILESQITDGSILARIASNETISGDWTWTGRLVTDDSTTTRAGFNVAEGVAPTVPVDGDIWVTVAGEFFARLNGVSVDLAAPAGAEVNDLTAAVTWDNIPDANVPVTAVTQHEAALTILESQITDGAILARVAGVETISGNWTHSGSLVTDDSTTTRAGFNIPTGVAPTVPVQGDMWVTAADAFIRINGVTESLLAGGGGALPTPTVLDSTLRSDGSANWFEETGVLISAAGVLTAEGNRIEVSGTSPSLRIEETDGTLDEKFVHLRHSSDQFRIQSATDAAPNTGVANLLAAARSGTAWTNAVWDCNLFILSDGTTLRVRDAGETDWADFVHDGADFNTTFELTADWNITGATGDMRVEGFVDLRMRTGTGLAINVDDNTTTAFSISPGAGSGTTTSMISTGNLSWSGGAHIWNQENYQIEQAAAAGDSATFGQYWVRDDVPNTPMFTDDAGNDFLGNQITELDYEYESAVTATDPGAGLLKFDSITIGSITLLYIDDLEARGTDAGWALSNLATDDTLTIRSASDPADYIVATVTSAPTDNTGWWTIPITLLHTGTIFTDGDMLRISVAWSSAVGGGGLADGTVTGSGLIWDSAAWVEAQALTTETFDLQWASPNVANIKFASEADAATLTLWGDELGAGGAIADVPSLHLRQGTTDHTVSMGFATSNDQDSQAIAMTGAITGGDTVIHADSAGKQLHLCVGNKTLWSASSTRIRMQSIGFPTTKFNEMLSGGTLDSEWDWNFTGTALLNFQGLTKGLLVDGGSLSLQENTAAGTDLAGFGQYWVRDDVPSTGMFTDDVGNDMLSEQITELDFEYESAVTATDPGAGLIKFNSVTIGSITTLYINDVEARGANAGFVLDNLGNGDVLTFRSARDPADYIVATVNGAPTDNTGWWTVPLTLVHTGTIMTDGDMMRISVTWSAVAAGVADGTVTGSGLIWSGSAWVEALALTTNTFRLDWLDDNIANVLISSDENQAVLTIHSDADGDGILQTRNPRVQFLRDTGGLQVTGNIGLASTVGDDDAAGAVMIDSTASALAIHSATTGSRVQIGAAGRAKFSVGANDVKFQYGTDPTLRFSQWQFTGASGEELHITHNNMEDWKIQDLTGSVFMDNSLKLQEQTVGDVDDAGYGQFWVRDDAPTTPMFTADDGAEFNLLGDTGVSEVVTTTNVITADETGTTFYLDLAGGFTSTLPVVGAGLKYRFVVKTAPTTAYIIGTNAGANIFFGTINEITTTAGISIQADDQIDFVAVTALIGDWVEVECDGTNWYVHGVTQVDGGITTTVT